MEKWVAKFNENDDPFGEEIYIGIAGGEYGYDAFLSNDEDSDVFPGVTPDETRENIEDAYGYFETFVWLDDEA